MAPMIWVIPVIGQRTQTRLELRVTAADGEVTLTTPTGTYLIPASSDVAWMEAVPGARRVVRQQAERGGY